MGDEASTVLVARIAQNMMAACPPGWRRAQVRWRQVGGRQEHDAAAVDADGHEVILTVPDDVLELFGELRRYQQSVQTCPWFSARVRLAHPDRFALDTDAEEPQFRGAPPEPVDYVQDAAVLGWTASSPWLADILDAATLAGQLPNSLRAVGATDGAVTFGRTPKPDGWTVVRRDGRWSAGRSEQGSQEFGTARDAAAYALGHVVLAQTEVYRANRPIDALPGDPPLTLFRDLRQLVVQPGTMLDRLCGPDGNVTYLGGTPFPMCSLPPELLQQPCTVYRVRRPVQALMGEAVAWFGQPGGGTACVLPVSIEELVRTGVLELT